MGRERQRITARRSAPPTEQAWAVDLASGDRIVVEYKPSGSDTSRMVVEDPDGVVVYDQTIGEHGSLRYVATAAGTHTMWFEWADSARIDLYLES